MDKLLKAITGMAAVEEEAKKCPDCAIGALCPKHDARFWELWRKAKRHLCRNPADSDERPDPGMNIYYKNRTIANTEKACPDCGGERGDPYTFCKNPCH